MHAAGDLLGGLDGWDPLSALGREGVDLSRIELQEALLLDMETYLPDAMLARATSAARAHSLEVKFPFLADELVEFACGVPAALKLRRFTRKYILKKAMKELLPDTILNRKKEGFSVPIKHWLRRELKPFLTDVLSERRKKNRGLVRPAAVTRLIDEHLSGRANHSHTLWALMVLEIWCDRYL
jgi:asparagine synthase (glutamine-hydrolysing)